LADFHRAYPRFRTMLYIAPTGRIVAAHPLVTPDGNKLVGQDVSDRQYFKQTMATRKPFVSDVFISRQMGTDPIVTLTAPVLNPDGSIHGVAYASLHCSRFRDFQASLASLGKSELVILDKQERLIFASPGAPFTAAQALHESPLVFPSPGKAESL